MDLEASIAEARKMMDDYLRFFPGQDEDAYSDAHQNVFAFHTLYGEQNILRDKTITELGSVWGPKFCVRDFTKLSGLMRAYDRFTH